MHVCMIPYVIPSACCAQSWHWQCVSPHNATCPPARADHTAVMWQCCCNENDGVHMQKDVMVIFGGSTASALLNDVWLYDVGQGSWAQVGCICALIDVRKACLSLKGNTFVCAALCKTAKIDRIYQASMAGQKAWSVRNAGFCHQRQSRQQV